MARTSAGPTYPGTGSSGTPRSSHPQRPLWRLYAGVYDEIPPRQDSATLRIPVRRDGVREGAEFLYLRIEMGGSGARYRIKVLDAG